MSTYRKESPTRATETAIAFARPNEKIAQDKLRFFEAARLTTLHPLDHDQMNTLLSIVSAADNGSKVFMHDDGTTSPILPEQMAGQMTHFKTRKFTLPLFLIGPQETIKPLEMRHLSLDENMYHYIIRIRIEQNLINEVRILDEGSVREVGSIQTDSESSSFGHTQDFDLHPDGFLKPSFRFRATPSFSIACINCLPDYSAGTMAGMNIYTRAADNK